MTNGQFNEYQIALFFFRRDLRLTDNTAFKAAEQFLYNNIF
ncbi:MAG: hypothetical protein PHR16_12950 [Methylovulum sp.]|nr:hypothetical protein [Methylovulum sp.]